MRHTVASLILAAVICVVLAENANPVVDTKLGVKEIENVHVELVPRIKRDDVDETPEFSIKVDDDSHLNHYRQPRRCRHRSKESCSDEDTVKIKLDIDEDDKSCCKSRHSKEKCSDEKDSFKIKLNVDDDKKCKSERSKECCSDDDTVKIKFDVDDDDKSCDDSRGSNYRDRQSYSNSPQIHYHHNIPAPGVVRVKEVNYGSAENGYRYKSAERSREHPRAYHSRNKYGGYGQESCESEENGSGTYGGRYGRRSNEPMVCEKEDSITIVV